MYSKTHQQFIWTAQSLLYIMFVYQLCYNQDAVKNYVPKLVSFHSEQSPIKYIPNVSLNRVQIWKLSELMGSGDINLVNDASELVGFKFVSLDQLKEFTKELQQTEVGTFEKFWNLFSLVNVIWTFAIAGISITFIPTVFYIFGPLALQLCKLIYNIGVMLYPYAEQIGYGLTIVILSQTVHMNKYVGYYFGLLSLSCYYAMNVYSTVKHDAHSFVGFMLCAIPTAFLTVYYESNFMGFVTVLLAYCSLGFMAVSSSLCIMIGFDNKLATSRCVVISMMFVPMYYHISTYTDFLKYFQYGAYIMGPIVYFLGLLISTELEKGPADLLMIGSIIVTLYTSAIISNLCMYNVALTFSVLYTFMTVGKILNAIDSVVIVFVTCVGLYYASLYLTIHPEFLASILNGA
jgi:hypothetical protein